MYHTPTKHPHTYLLTKHLYKQNPNKQPHKQNRQRDPQRCCDMCAQLLTPLQPFLVAATSACVQPPVHDALDAVSLRSWLNNPWGSSMGDEVYKVGVMCDITFGECSHTLRKEGLHTVTTCNHACVPEPNLRFPRSLFVSRLFWLYNTSTHRQPTSCTRSARCVFRVGCAMFDSTAECDVAHKLCDNSSAPLLPAHQHALLYTQSYSHYLSNTQALRPELERHLPTSLLRGARGLALLSVMRVGAGWSCTAGTGLVMARQRNGAW